MWLLCGHYAEGEFQGVSASPPLAAWSRCGERRTEREPFWSNDQRARERIIGVCRLLTLHYCEPRDGSSQPTLLLQRPA